MNLSRSGLSCNKRNIGLSITSWIQAPNAFYVIMPKNVKYTRKKPLYLLFFQNSPAGR